MKLLPELQERFPDITPPAPLQNPEHEQQRIFEAISQFLEIVAKEHRSLIFVDDLQWGDSSSIEYLAHLRSKLAEIPILLIGAHRLEELDDAHPLMSLIAPEDLEQRISQFKLESLESGEAEELISTALKLDMEKSVDLVPKVVEYAKGHPLYIVEILYWLVKEEVLFAGRDDVWLVDVERWESMPPPPGVEKLIAQRLRRVSRRAREILDIASTRPSSFDMPFLIKALFRPKLELIYDLEELLSVYMIHAHPRGYEFRHDMIRQVVYESLKDELKEDLHLRSGEAIELLHEAGEKHYGIEVVGELAHHFYVADEKPKSLTYSLQAGDHVWSTSYAKRESLNHFERALELAEELGDEQGEILSLKGLGEVCAFTDEQERGFAYCERGLELCDDPEIRAEFHIAKSNVHQSRRDLETALDCCETAVSDLPDDAGPAIRSRCYYYTSTFLN